MKVLLTILLIVIAIASLILISALFIEKQYLIEREISIKKPVSEVFNYLRFLKNQENFSKWVMADPQMQKEFSGTDGTVGFIYKWEGEKAGKGEQEIAFLAENEQINMVLRFKKPFESNSTTYFKTSTNGDETLVKWGMNGENPYPMNFMNLFIPGILGKDISESLSRLKMVLEKD